MSDCVSSEACTKKQKGGWMTMLFLALIVPSFYESSEFSLDVLKAAQTSTVGSQFSQKKGLWDLMGWTRMFGMVNNL